MGLLESILDEKKTKPVSNDPLVRVDPETGSIAIGADVSIGADKPEGWKPSDDIPESDMKTRYEDRSWAWNTEESVTSGGKYAARPEGLPARGEKRARTTRKRRDTGARKG